MMISHHTQAKQRQSSLGLSTAASPMLITLSQEGRQTLATLKAKRGTILTARTCRRRWSNIRSCSTAWIASFCRAQNILNFALSFKA